jgi:hypothetical protein
MLKYCCVLFALLLGGLLTACGGSDSLSNNENGLDYRSPQENAPRFADTWQGSYKHNYEGSQCTWNVTLQLFNDQYTGQISGLYKANVIIALTSQSHTNTSKTCLPNGKANLQWSAVGSKQNSTWSYILNLAKWEYFQDENYSVIKPDGLISAAGFTTNQAENILNNIRLRSDDPVIQLWR